MFENITIHRRLKDDNQKPFSVGHLCECLFFFKEVNLVCTKLELIDLFRKANETDLFSLLEKQSLKIHLLNESYGTSRLAANRIGYGTFQGKGTSTESEIYKALYSVYHNSTKTLSWQEKLMPFISDYSYNYKIVSAFLENGEFTTRVFKAVILDFIPEYPIPLDFFFRLTGAQKDENIIQEKILLEIYNVESNFDITTLENELRKRGHSISQGFLVQFTMRIIGTLLDLGLAETFTSELALEEFSSKLLQEAIKSVKLEDKDGQDEIVSFQEHILDPFPSISNAINSGHKTFSDFNSLLNKSDIFKAWLISRDFESGVVNEYIKECNLKKFSDTEEVQVLKYLYSAAAKSVLPVVPLVTGTAELIGGYGVKKITESLALKLNMWRPNQFVDSDLRQFLR
jgi:hypothetical protein